MPSLHERSRDETDGPLDEVDDLLRIPASGPNPRQLGDGEHTDRALPAAINLREVGLRDGLQLEQPISTDSKLELLANLADAGVRRIEATSFVSPRVVPALADADQLAAELHHWPHVVFSALVANVRGARRAIEAGIVDLEFVVSAADGHSIANVGRPTSEALAATSDITRLVHAAGGTCEVITRWLGTARSMVRYPSPGPWRWPGGRWRWGRIACASAARSALRHRPGSSTC